MESRKLDSIVNHGSISGASASANETSAASRASHATARAATVNLKSRLKRIRDDFEFVDRELKRCQIKSQKVTEVEEELDRTKDALQRTEVELSEATAFLRDYGKSWSRLDMRLTKHDNLISRAEELQNEVKIAVERYMAPMCWTSEEIQKCF